MPARLTARSDNRIRIGYLPTARRREPPALYIPLEEPGHPGAGHLVIRIGCALVEVLRRPRRRRQRAPAMQLLVADEEQRLPLLCQQITHTRQGASK